MTDEEVLHAFDGIRVWQQGGRRAVHKPLLILLALGRLARAEPPMAEFSELDGPLSKLLAEFGWTQEELAQRIGKDRTSIANSLRMLKLPEEIQADLRNGRLTMGHARALLAVTSSAEQFRLRDQILANDWSVRTTEDSIRATETVAVAKGLTLRRGRRRSVELESLEEALQRGLMTRVRIVGNERRGKIVVTYATPGELERLSDIFGARH